MTQLSLPAGAVDEDASHGLGRGREEVPVFRPAGIDAAHELHIGFVIQRRGMQGLAGALLPEMLGREATQFVVDQGEQLVGSLELTVADFNEQTL